eukprot:7758094-Alexandrium_andersonii.AAC.1
MHPRRLHLPSHEVVVPGQHPPDRPACAPELRRLECLLGTFQEVHALPTLPPRRPPSRHDC